MKIIAQAITALLASSNLLISNYGLVEGAACFPDSLGIKKLCFSPSFTEQKSSPLLETNPNIKITAFFYNNHS